MMNREKIQKLINHAEFKKALRIIHNLENTNGINLTDYLVYSCFKSQVLVKTGKTEKGLEIANKTLTRVRNQLPENQLLLVDTIITKTEVLRLAKKFFSSYSRVKLSEYLQLLEEGERKLKSILNLELQEKTERIAILRRNKGLIYRSLGEYGHAESYLQESLTLYKKLDKKAEIIEVLTDLALIFKYRSDYDRQITIFQECLSLNKELKDQEGIAETYLNFADVYQNKGELETASKYIQRSLHDINDLPRTLRVARVFFNIGIFYHNMRDDTAIALTALQRSLSLSEDLDDKDGIQLCTHLLGDLYQYSKGDLNRALEYYKRSKALFKEDGQILVHCWNLLDVGNLYHLKGDLDLALDHFNEALPLLENISDDFYFCQTFLHIGRVYRSKGDNNTALDHYKRCLKLLDDRKLQFGQETEGLAYYELIAVMLDNSDINQAKDYFALFNQYYENNPRSKRFLNQWYKLANALILKNSIRIKDKAQAQQLFQEIIDDPDLKFNLLNFLADSKKTATLNLCELLLFELKSSSDAITPENELFQEVKKLLLSLASLAQNQHSFPLLVDVTILQAKLALIEGNLTVAMQFLDQAKITAVECDLKRLYNRVLGEENHLKTQLSVWETLIRENAPLQERLAQARVEDYLLEAKKMVGSSFHSST